MGRNLTTSKKNGLKNEQVHPTVKIELQNGSILRFATANLLIGGQSYLGKMATKEPLRMGLTRKVDKVSFELFNVDLVLGIALIDVPTAFKNSFATLGTWHKNSVEEWHDEKVPGEIKHSEIDGEAVYCKFKAITDVTYQGISIVSKFPGLPPQNETTTIIIEPGIIPPFIGGPGRGRLPIDDNPFDGRRYFPFEEVGRY